MVYEAPSREIIVLKNEIPPKIDVYYTDIVHLPEIMFSSSQVFPVPCRYYA